ncbi:MAG: hypothetical protein WAQ56_01610 [Candidatus Nitrotoga sp.]
MRIRAEPVTISALAAAAAIATIVGAVVGVVSGIDTSKKLGEINARLDAIIATQEQILDELRNMRFYFDAKLLGQWQDINENTIKVQFLRFAGRVDSPLTSGLTDELTQILRDLENPAFSLATKFGVAAYVSFASALSLELLIYRKLLKPRIEIQNISGAYAKALRIGWLNKNDPASIYNLIDDTAREIPRRIAELNARARTYEVGHRTDYDGGTECTVNVTVFTNITGTFDSGFTAKPSEAGGSKKCGSAPGCHNPRTCLQANAVDELLGKATSQITTEEPTFNLPDVPPFIPSGNGYLDSFLRERTDIFARKRDLVAYEFLRDAMEVLAGYLEGPIN